MLKKSSDVADKMGVETKDGSQALSQGWQR